MKRPIIALIFAALAAWAFSCTESATEVSEANVRKIMDEVQTATRNRDIEGVMKHLAPGVIINITTDTPFGKQRIRLLREEYEMKTRDVWSLATEYEYRPVNEKITVSEDRRSATVETEVVEHVVVRGQTTRMRTREKATLEIVDGQLLVTVLEGVTSRE